MVPADDQAMVFPCASVMVIIVLLKVAFTCATPEAMFLRSRRRTRVASLPILHPLATGRCVACRSHRADIAPVAPRPGMRRPRSTRGAATSLLGLLFLAGDRLGRPLAGAGVGMGA